MLTVANCWCGRKYSMGKEKSLAGIGPEWRPLDKLSSARNGLPAAHLVSRSLVGAYFSTKDHPTQGKMVAPPALA